MRSLKVKKIDIIAFVLLFLIFTYSFTKAGIHDYIYPNSIACYISFGIIILFSILLGSISSIRKCTLLEGMMLLCMIVILCNRNNNFIHGEFEDGFSFIAIAIFFLLVRKQDSWHKLIMPIIWFWVAIHTIVTLLEYAVSGFYMSQIFPLMPSYAEMHLRSVFKLGYMPGLAVHYSTNGMYLAVGLIISGISLLFSKAHKRIGAIVFIVTAVALLLTGKRGLIIFPAAALVMVYYLYNSDKPLSRFGKIIVLAIAVIVLFTIGSTFIPSLSNFINRFVETSEAGDVSLGRLEQSALALNVFSHNWLFGTGWDSFKYLYKAQFGTLLNVHNIYIQLLSENGIIGAFPFFVFFIAAFFRAIKSLIYLRKYYTGEYYAGEFYIGLSLAMQCFFLLYGMTGNPLYDQQVFYPYIVSIAAGEFYVDQVYHMIRTAEVSE